MSWIRQVILQALFGLQLPLLVVAHDSNSLANIFDNSAANHLGLTQC